MKRISTLLMIAFSSISLTQAQVTITRATHGLHPGEAHSCQKVEYREPGNAGKNLTWDFSKLSLLDELSTSTVIANESGNGYNLVIKRSDNYSFLFNNTDKANEYKGYQIGSRTILFTQPIIKTVYPQTYGTQFEGNFEGVVSREGATTMGESLLAGSYSTHADATGTILLPDGIRLPVLRVKTIEKMNYSNCSKSFMEVVKYLWYAQDVRYPVFVSIETISHPETGNPSVVKRESYLNVNIEQELMKKNSTPNLLSDQSKISYKVFPNPFKEDIQVNYMLPQETTVHIDLYNSQGTKLITLVSGQLQKGEQSVSRNVSPYTQLPDIYFLIMKFGNKVYTEKLIKAAN